MASPLRGMSPSRSSTGGRLAASSLHATMSGPSRRGEASSLVVDDLLHGMHEWRNIQDVIRNTFKALHDVIKAQGEAVRGVERQLEAKASNADAQAALLRKANITDVNRSLTDITHALEGKCSVYDIEQKPDRGEVQLALRGKANAGEVAAELTQKADREEFDAFRHSVEKHMQAMQGRIEELQTEVERRYTREECQKMVEARVDGVVRETADLLNDQKKGMSNVVELLSQSARRDDVVKALEGKADAEEVRKHLQGKAGFDSLEESMVAQEKALQRMARDIAGKADVKDINILLDGKADVDEVNRALLDVNSQMHLKASMADISATLQEQALLNSALISELCLGRWIWKSLKTKAGGAVPWNVQTANSDPSNLLWEKDKSYIVAVAPGLYEVQFGFYSRRKPVVKLHVNGEPVMTINGGSPSVCYHAGGRLLSSGRYTNSNVTGLTHVDFIALPSKARVSMSYQGDDDAEAFITLRKF